MASNLFSSDTAVIGLGANLPSQAGHPVKTLRAALAMLAGRLELLAVSPFYETASWPDPAAPAFLNAVAVVRSRLQPLALLTLLHDVETAFGRKRSAPNAPRSLDLDLLDHGGRVIGEGPPILPHPRIAGRRFVLEPLAAVAPGWRHPVTGLSAQTLLARQGQLLAREPGS